MRIGGYPGRVLLRVVALLGFLGARAGWLDEHTPSEGLKFWTLKKLEAQ